MMTSSNGNIFRVTGPLCGEFTGPGEFPAQRPVTRSFDVFFDLRLNKRLSKQSWGWWFETPSCSLWRHRNAEFTICNNGPVFSTRNIQPPCTFLGWEFVRNDPVCVFTFFFLLKTMQHRNDITREYYSFYKKGLTLIPAWISKHMPIRLWDAITYPFSNVSGRTVAVWEWISNFTPHFVMYVVT